MLQVQIPGGGRRRRPSTPCSPPTSRWRSIGRRGGRWRGTRSSRRWRRRPAPPPPSPPRPPAPPEAPAKRRGMRSSPPAMGPPGAATASDQGTFRRPWLVPSPSPVGFSVSRNGSGEREEEGVLALCGWRVLTRRAVRWKLTWTLIIFNPKADSLIWLEQSGL